MKQGRKLTSSRVEGTVGEIDPLTAAWLREMERISEATELEAWEEVLVLVTFEMEATMTKIRAGRPLETHDHFLLDLLSLLVLPNPGDPRADRDLAIRRFSEQPSTLLNISPHATV